MQTGEVPLEAGKIARVRADIYEILARGFLKEPSKAYLNQVKLLAHAFNPLQKNLISADALSEAELKQEYYDRFFVPSSGKYVPPFESAVIRREIKGHKVCYGSLNGLETLHVLQCYESVGFNPWELDVFKPVKSIILADYIGFELAFMSFLCHAQADKEMTQKVQTDSLTKGDDNWQRLQKSFLENHLGKWCFDYERLVKQLAPGFYPKLLTLVCAWITYDLDTQLNRPGGL